MKNPGPRNIYHFKERFGLDLRGQWESAETLDGHSGSRRELENEMVKGLRGPVSCWDKITEARKCHTLNLHVGNFLFFFETCSGEARMTLVFENVGLGILYRIPGSISPQGKSGLRTD